MPRKNPLPGRNQPQRVTEDWLLTYSDMVTLILCFFILLGAISTIDPAKLQQVAQSMIKAMRGKVEQPIVSLQEVADKVSEIVQKQHLEEDVDVEVTPRGVVINAKGAIFFASGRAEILESAKPLLYTLTEEIKRVPYNIAVEGHTDNVPISTPEFSSNWELSAARATQVVRFFIKQGVPKERLQAIAYADTKPRVPNTTPEGFPIPENQAKNRRVAIVFLTF